MICKPCRQGGKWNLQWSQVSMGTDAPAFAFLEALAKGGHEQCDGKCDCQHVAGRTATVERKR